MRLRTILLASACLGPHQLPAWAGQFSVNLGGSPGRLTSIYSTVPENSFEGLRALLAGSGLRIEDPVGLSPLFAHQDAGADAVNLARQDVINGALREVERAFTLSAKANEADLLDVIARLRRVQGGLAPWIEGVGIDLKQAGLEKIRTPVDLLDTAPESVYGLPRLVALAQQMAHGKLEREKVHNLEQRIREYAAALGAVRVSDDWLAGTMAVAVVPSAPLRSAPGLLPAAVVSDSLFVAPPAPGEERNLRDGQWTSVPTTPDLRFIALKPADLLAIMELGGGQTMIFFNKKTTILGPLGLTMGRNPRGDGPRLVASSERLSKEHLSIEGSPEKTVFRDLNSRNGTTVGVAKFVPPPAPGGDPIKLVANQRTFVPLPASKRVILKMVGIELNLRLGANNVWVLQRSGGGAHPVSANVFFVLGRNSGSDYAYSGEAFSSWQLVVRVGEAGIDFVDPGSKNGTSIEVPEGEAP